MLKWLAKRLLFMIFYNNVIIIDGLPIKFNTKCLSDFEPLYSIFYSVLKLCVSKNTHRRIYIKFEDCINTK